MLYQMDRAGPETVTNRYETNFIIGYKFCYRPLTQSALEYIRPKRRETPLPLLLQAEKHFLFLFSASANFGFQGI
jgi:hypothetical protein